MVAVVDGQAELGVEIGAAAAAGLGGRLAQLDLDPGGGQTHGGGEAGQPGADDIGPTRPIRTHPIRPRDKTIQSRAALPILARSRGGAQPAASILVRMLA